MKCFYGNYGFTIVHVTRLPKPMCLLAGRKVVFFVLFLADPNKYIASQRDERGCPFKWETKNIA